MKWSEFSKARAACAYFFICPGLVYGLLTARLPALKTQTGADDAQIGLILLCLGVSGLAALCGSARLIARWGSRAVLRLGSLALLFSLPFCGLASTPLSLALACVLVGCGTGLADVAMNTQGIQIERRYHAPCMALMHASYSFGGVMGSLAGALFAALGFSPLVNFIGVLGGCACFPVSSRTARRSKRRGKEPPALCRFSLSAAACLPCALTRPKARWRNGAVCCFSA